jgi:queuine tRNA-ribosyltransferase
MPRDRPRYLMGVGTPFDLLHAIAAGIDMFDCVLPTRNARNGQALTWGGRVNLKQQRHRSVDLPLDARCDCDVCRRYSRAYLRHLIQCGEMLGARLLTQHNLHFYASLMRQSRRAIAEQRYLEFMGESETRMRELDEVGNGPHAAEQ